MRLFAALLVLVACSAPPATSPPPADPTGHGIAWASYGSGSPLVLLNGTGSPMSEWDPAFVSQLARNHRVIVFDYPGLGGSTAPAQRTFEGLADATAQFLTDIDVPAADVLGWSMGGFIVQEMMRRHPERIERAVLVGTNPGGSRARLGPAWVQRADSDPDAGVRVYLRTNYPHNRCAQRRGRAFLDRLPASTIVPARTYRLMVAAEDPWLRSNRNARQLQTVAVPTLVMVGDRDVVTPPANSRALASLLPQSRLLTVPGAGHSVLFQAPKASAAAISAFLRADPLPPATWPCT